MLIPNASRLFTSRRFPLLIQRSAILLLDPQITEEGAQQLALEWLVLLGNDGLPVLQIVIGQD
jgi:hypothetical protein